MTRARKAATKMARPANPQSCKHRTKISMSFGKRLKPFVKQPWDKSNPRGQKHELEDKRF
eukprot:11223451-Lingulodinium_polyedra.AAC.1